MGADMHSRIDKHLALARLWLISVGIDPNDRGPEGRPLSESLAYVLRSVELDGRKEAAKTCLEAVLAIAKEGD